MRSPEMPVRTSNALRCIVLNTALAFISLPAGADVSLPSVLAEHMVIERDRPVHLWGSADPGEQISIEFRGNQDAVTADKTGQWSIFLPPGPAGGPFALSIRGKNEIYLSDILVGDVWLASGQSNMEFPIGLNRWWHLGVREMKQEIEGANFPTLRLFHVEMQYSEFPETDLAARTWVAAKPESVSDFSAVAYFFGRELIQKEHIPIGIIESDVGGTPAEAWTSLDALSSDPSLMPVFAVWSDEANHEPADKLREKMEKQEYEKQVQEGLHPQPLSESRSQLFNAPAHLYNAMIAPLTPFPIRGAIWYQGESNTDMVRAPLYFRLLPTMITDWRSRWAQGDFPFLFVQIANFNPMDQSQGWPTVREAQRKTLSLANTGMAVAIDIGDPADIHPRDKQDVGHRLALWARAISYGEHLEDSGPLFRQAVPEGTRIRVWFDHSSSGLMTRGGQLKAFELAGADGLFVPASARIDGDTVVISSENVPAPVYVRYGWSSSPECNLYNNDGLPAPPFTSRP